MRYLLTASLLACMLAGGGAFAKAAPAAGTAPIAVLYSYSPDVAQWRASGEPAAHKAALHGISKKHMARFAHRLLNRTTSIARRLTSDALRYLGTPYVFGGESGYGFDCSGYTQHVFALMGVHIPRTADAQYYSASRATGGPRTGDLVFFQTYEPGPSHVGIYLGNGQFVHASSSHGVMVSSLSDSYWSARYLGARRVL